MQLVVNLWKQKLVVFFPYEDAPLATTDKFFFTICLPNRWLGTSQDKTKAVIKDFRNLYVLIEPEVNGV